jgi:hypothetical protein
MALTKEVRIDRLEILGDEKRIQCREATIVKEDGVELTRTFHRHILTPTECSQNEDGSFTHVDTDVSGEPQETQDICAAIWTDAVVAKWKTHIENIITGAGA